MSMIITELMMTVFPFIWAEKQSREIMLNTKLMVAWKLFGFIEDVI